MSFKKAIEKKYVTDHRIWIPSISETNLSIYEIDNLIKSKCIFFISCLSKNGSQKCITYCTDNDKIDLVMEAMNKLNDYYCLDFETNKINANSNSKSRDDILNDFQIQLLLSIRTLGRTLL